eukprot:3593397-Prymnesium_polylepis.1
MSPHVSAAMAARSSPVPPPAGEPDARVACRNKCSCSVSCSGIAPGGRCSIKLCSVYASSSRTRRWSSRICSPSTGMDVGLLAPSRSTTSGLPPAS